MILGEQALPRSWGGSARAGLRWKGVTHLQGINLPPQTLLLSPGMTLLPKEQIQFLLWRLWECIFYSLPGHFCSIISPPKLQVSLKSSLDLPVEC